MMLTGAIVFDSEPLVWSYGIGWGIHIPVSIFSFNADITCNSMNEDEDPWGVSDGSLDLLPRIRGSVGVNLGKYMTIYAGYLVNVYMPGLYNNYDPDDCWEIGIPFHDKSAYLSPEFFAGISFHLR